MKLNNGVLTSVLHNIMLLFFSSFFLVTILLIYADVVYLVQVLKFYIILPQGRGIGPGKKRCRPGATTGEKKRGPKPKRGRDSEVGDRFVIFTRFDIS